MEEVKVEIISARYTTTDKEQIYVVYADDTVKIVPANEGNKDYVRLIEDNITIDEA